LRAAVQHFRSPVPGRRFSARRCAVASRGEDIRHAINHAIAVDEAGDDPVRCWCPDRTGPETGWNWW